MQQIMKEKPCNLQASLTGRIGSVPMAGVGIGVGPGVDSSKRSKSVTAKGEHSPKSGRGEKEGPTARKETAARALPALMPFISEMLKQELLHHLEEPQSARKNTTFELVRLTRHEAAKPLALQGQFSISLSERLWTAQLQ